MKRTNLFSGALLWVLMVVVTFSGCEKLELYEIDAPQDLQSKIDSIAAAREGRNTGDTTYIDIIKSIVGAEDNSSGWWADHSDYFEIAPGKLLTLEFINYGTGSNNWNNWNLALTTKAYSDGDPEYSEYFVLRSDAYGWGNGDFALERVEHNYGELGGEDIWAVFRHKMQGAYVTLEVDFSPTGNIFVTSTAVATDGTVLVQSYNHPVPVSSSVTAFLVVDGSHFLMKKAYLLPAKVKEIEDEDAVSIQVTDAPTAVELGSEDFWGLAKAVVTFTDGSTKELSKEDLHFNVVPDTETLGAKTVVVAYSKTKQGKPGPTVSTVYNLSVVMPVQQIEVTQNPLITTYYFFSDDSIILDTRGLVVTATYGDDSQGVMPLGNLSIGKVPPFAGTHNITITYKGETSTVSTTLPITMVKGSGQVGATDFSTGFAGDVSANIAIPYGESLTYKLKLYSLAGENWHNATVRLQKSDGTLTTFARMDHWAWGDGYIDGTTVGESNWNWDTFKAGLHGSSIEITITNNGDNTADVEYLVTYANGEEHFQRFLGISVDSSDLNTAITVERCYVVFTE